MVCFDKEKQRSKEFFFLMRSKAAALYTCINIPFIFSLYMNGVNNYKQLTDEKNVHYVLIQHLFCNCFLSKLALSIKQTSYFRQKGGS